jgi:hypothetical protein
MALDNLKGWNKEIYKVTKKFIDSFGSLTELQLNCKPNPNGWSIAQNIDHQFASNLYKISGRHKSCLQAQ